MSILLSKCETLLVHFKPEWSEKKDVQKIIENRIRSKFPRSPFMQGDSDFPEKCICYGCAKWCVESTLTFAKFFCTESGIENKFLKHLNRFDVAIPSKPPETEDGV